MGDKVTNLVFYVQSARRKTKGDQELNEPNNYEELKGRSGRQIGRKGRHRQADTNRKTQSGRHRQADTDWQTHTGRHRQEDTDMKTVRLTQTGRHCQADTDRQADAERQ